MDNNNNDIKKKGLKEFLLTSLAVDNRTSVFLITLMILLFGISSYNSMPKEAFPEIPWPKIYVNTVYFGNSATDIENLVTRPLEKEISDISGLKSITSSSLQDYSLIVAEFNPDIKIEDAARKVKDAADKARTELPDDLTVEPEVLEVNLSELPVMTVNISGDYSNDELRSFAEYMQDELEDLTEISSVDIKGIMEKEVSVDMSIAAMNAMKVSFTDVENAFRSENVTMSGGEVLSNDFRRTIRIVGEFENVEEMGAMIVKSEDGNTIYLRDIAKVEFGFKEETSIARENSNPVVSLDVIKKSGENLLTASDNIKVLVNNAKENVLPKDLRVTIFNDLSIATRNNVKNLENSILSGVILVILVLLFFLGIRNAIFVGLAIPLSMLMGILIINMIGYSLNIVVLFALILALGLLVDNAIVVVENIYRYMQQGSTGIEAAKQATGEVALPIIASTATTLIAFIPLAFWPGLIGSFMKFLPITLIVVLSSSLFVALVINPVLTSRFMKVDKKATKNVYKRKRRNIIVGSIIMILIACIAHLVEVNWLRNILVIAGIFSLLNFFALRPASFYFQNKIIPALESAYNWFINIALNRFNPYLIFAGTFGLLFGAFMLLGAYPPKVVLFPEPDPLFVNAFVELPVGKDIKTTDDVMKRVEETVKKVIEPYQGIVESVLSQIGENTADPSGPPQFGSSPNKARLSVSFVPDNERGGISTKMIMDEIRASLTNIPGVDVTVGRNQAGPPQEKPINIELKGEDVGKLAKLSEDLIKYINAQGIGGIEELQADVKLGKPELVINIDREAARRYQISTYAIGDVIRTAVFGKEVSKFKQGEDDYEINLRVDYASRHNIDALMNQNIAFRNPSNGRIVQVPISAVASVEYSSTFTSVNRKNEERMITVYSNILEGFNPTEVVNQIRGVLESYEFPEWSSFSFTGQQEQMAKEMEFLGGALLIAVFGIFIIIVTQFNSVISPFIILLTVLFSTIGVFLGYVFGGRDIEIVMTGVGIISLAGIVVNNAIVLIDYINLVLKRKRLVNGQESLFEMDKQEVKEAIIEGGATRLRPVLLTAITTVLGLVPLAIGFNFDFGSFITNLDPQFFIGGDNAAFWGSMAWTVIYGLVFATFLTLVVVPVMYWLSYKMNFGLMKLFK